MAAGGGEYRAYPQRFSAISSMNAVPKFAVRPLDQESSAGLDPALLKKIIYIAKILSRG